MRFPTPILLTLAVVALPAADAQVSEVKRGGGLFGFGFNRNAEQMSSELFPTEEGVPAATPVRDSSGSAESDGETIFRYGEPQDVDEASYVIRDGRRVETPARTRKVGLFNFGRKKPAPETADQEVIEPIPAPAASESESNPSAGETSSSPAESVERAAPVASQRPESQGSRDDSPRRMADEEKDDGGFFSFFSRKSKEDEPRAEPAPTAAPVADPVDRTARRVAPREVAPREVAPREVAPREVAPREVAPTEQSTQSREAAMAEAETESDSRTESSDDAPPADPVPEFAGVENAPEPQKKEKDDGGGLLSPITKPISNLRPSKPDRPVDMTGAETIIEDGEIVENEGAEPMEASVVSDGDGQRQPPEVVDGVKTYSSWEDVEGRSVSAADQILDQIR